MNSLRDAAVAQFQRSIETPTRFFETHADRVSQCSFEMAKRFVREGRLLVFGSGSSTTDAQHVSVEFVHPVIVGKRALPAIALTNDIGSVLGLAAGVGVENIFAGQLGLIGTRDDIALGLAINGNDAGVLRALHAAKAMGMLTIGMCGMDSELSTSQDIDFCFDVPSYDPYMIQEVQETTYHILWETVHVFFEHKGLM
jgi:D-sedoheptulose 7-phosphate isomerase